MSKGADLTIQCLLLSIEKWQAAHPDRKFPETLYIQIDGGSENANQHVYAACEWLVAKRMVKKVVLSRLPTGHTHEDIDATFAHLWRWMRGRTIETPQDLKTGVEEYFRSTALRATVEDIYVMPDYQAFFSPCIDDKFGRYTKLIGTQHCFKFEAVNSSQYFPLGVKVSYRAYCSDQVVEIEKKPKHLCITPIGQLTGLEAYTTIVKWYPDKETSPERPVEGFYILTGMPNTECLPGSRRPWLPPKPFEEGSKQEIAETIVAVRCHFTRDSSKHQQRQLWEDWIRDFAPGNFSATEYVSNGNRPQNYRIPLRSYLPSSIVCAPTWGMILPRFINDSAGFEWPLALAACMPSVCSRFNPHPPNPRLYASSDQTVLQHLERFRNATTLYYANVLSQLTLPELKTILRRRARSNGQYDSLSGLKSTLLTRVKQSDESFVSVMYRSLPQDCYYFVIEKTQNYLANSSMENEVAATITIDSNKFEVSRKNIQEFAPGGTIGIRSMSIIMALFQKRENIRVEAVYNVHHNDNGFTPITPSVFLSPDIWGRLIAKDTEYLQSVIPVAKVLEYYHVYIPICVDDQRDSWSLLIIEPQNKTITYYDPKVDTSVEEQSLNYLQRLDQNATVLQEYISTAANWRRKIIKTTVEQRLTPDLTDFNSGIYCSAFVERYLYSIPLVFGHDDMVRYRLNLCYDLLCENMQ